MKELEKIIDLTNQQLAAIEMVKKNMISVLIGKPGTGKTTATKEIIRWARSKKMVITQCAPTGKAAKRMIESTGFPAATVHSTLRCGFDNGGFVFYHNRENPLPTDLLIVDELSMMDNWLTARLLEAMDHTRTRILLIGDSGQLPSVSAGAVLRDIVESEMVPVTELDIIHRNSGKIVEACASISEGKSFTPAKALDMETDNKINLIHVNTSNMAGTIKAIVGIAADRMPLRGFDPIWDIQVISPVNKKTDLSCENLNTILQAKMNPASTLEKGFVFKAGDKVINTKNEKVQKTDNRQSYIVNGDMGRIVDVKKKNIIVEFFEPTREVKLSRSSNNLLLAYAVTCHRMQGSEVPVVIIPVDKAFSYFCDRKWLYTAISRAKDICILVGDFGAVDRMINNTMKLSRHTMLRQRIIDACDRFEENDNPEELEEFFDI